MFPLIFRSLCAQKFWRVRTFSGNSLRIKAVLCPKLGEDQKRGIFTLNCGGFCARKVYCMSYYCNFTINSNVSVRSKFMRVRSL